MRRPARSMRATQPGFTLIEMLVVLAIMALTVVFVTPAVRPPAEPLVEPMQAVIDAARRAAVRRAGTVILRFETDGSWVLQDPRAGMDDVIGTGTLSPPSAEPVRLRINSLGACLPAGDRSTVPLVDPVRCRILKMTGMP